jgi:Na+-driven multidrug efflux pump
MGTAALVLGIIGVVLAVLFFPLGILLGVVAAVLGYLGRKKAARREATNRGQATAGLVLGLVAILVGGIIAAVLGNFLAENSDEISNLSECVTDADTEEERTACAEEFEDEVGG